VTPERQRELWRKQRAAYRAKHTDRCFRCAKVALPGTRSCAFCLARSIERHKPGVEHDTHHHAAMLMLARDPSARCAASGLTRDQLAAVGEWLEVDRIDSYRGYVRGNCQLLARCLNRSKWREDAPAEWAVEELVQLASGAA